MSTSKLIRKQTSTIIVQGRTEEQCIFLITAISNVYFVTRVRLLIPTWKVQGTCSRGKLLTLECSKLKL